MRKRLDRWIKAVTTSDIVKVVHDASAVADLGATRDSLIEMYQNNIFLRSKLEAGVQEANEAGNHDYSATAAELQAHIDWGELFENILPIFQGCFAEATNIITAKVESNGGDLRQVVQTIKDFYVEYEWDKAHCLLDNIIEARLHAVKFEKRSTWVALQQWAFAFRIAQDWKRKLDVR